MVIARSERRPEFVELNLNILAARGDSHVDADKRDRKSDTDRHSVHSSNVGEISPLDEIAFGRSSNLVALSISSTSPLGSYAITSKYSIARVQPT